MKEVYFLVQRLLKVMIVKVFGNKFLVGLRKLETASGTIFG
jgi:hypothetical protein